MTARASPPDANPLWVDVVFVRVRAQEPNGASNVINLSRELILRGMPVIDRRDHISASDHLRQFEHVDSVRLVTTMPTAAMDIDCERGPLVSPARRQIEV